MSVFEDFKLTTSKSVSKVIFKLASMVFYKLDDPAIPLNSPDLRSLVTLISYPDSVTKNDLSLAGYPITTDKYDLASSYQKNILITLPQLDLTQFLYLQKSGRLYMRTLNSASNDPELVQYKDWTLLLDKGLLNGKSLYRESVNTEHIHDKSITRSKIADETFFNMRQRNKTYEVGDIAYSYDLPSWARLECVKSGETSNSELSEKGLFFKLLSGDVSSSIPNKQLRIEVKDPEEVLSTKLTPFYTKAEMTTMLNSDPTIEQGYAVRSIIDNQDLPDNTIISPFINMNPKVLDQSKIYFTETGEVASLSEEVLKDFEKFSQIFGAKLTIIDPAYSKHVLASIRTDNPAKAAFVRVRLSSTKDFSAWEDAMNSNHTVGLQMQFVLIPDPAKLVKKIDFLVDIRNYQL